MNLLKSFIISFSMYSILPMPRIQWEKDNMKYTFLFFPWIGLLIGGLSYGWYQFSTAQGLGINFTAIILVLIPVTFTGGIHMDGWIDTCDAVFSYGDKDKKLEILKDPRTGAFGVIGCVVYHLFLFGCYSQLMESSKFVSLLWLIFFISRSLGAIALLTVKKAKANGLGATFAAASHDKINLAVLIGYVIVSMVLICMIQVTLGFLTIAILGGFLFYYILAIKKNFGGITGDLTGFLILAIELILLMLTTIGGLLL